MFWISDNQFGHVNGTSIRTSFLNGTIDKQAHLNFTPSDVRYHADTRTLYFTAQVWEGSTLEDVKRDDEAYENRGFDAEVFDELFIRCVSFLQVPPRIWC